MYPVVFIDAIHVKVRDGQVTNKAFYVAIGVTVSGEREILGIWSGTGGEGAKQWMGVLTELKNRGVADICMLVCDGLKGPPEAVAVVWKDTTVQTCVIHLLRNTFKYAARQNWDAIARDIKPVYTAPTAAAAEARFTSSPTRGAPATPRRSGCGARRGRSSFPSSPTTSRSAASSVRRTRSSR